MGTLVLAVAVQAQDFTRTMTADERAAAGLDKLSPAELARLRAAVERYKAGAVAVVQEQAEQKVAATEAKAKEAEQKAAATEAKARAAEEKAARAEAMAQGVQAKPTDKDGRKLPSWLTALVTLEKAAKAPDANEALEVRLKGDFRGWRKGTVFDLENGQRWQHIEGEDYVTPPMPAPVVRIKPGMLGTFWMEIEGVRPRVKVKPLKIE